jgi:hypothetical protein
MARGAYDIRHRAGRKAVIDVSRTLLRYCATREMNEWLPTNQWVRNPGRERGEKAQRDQDNDGRCFGLDEARQDVR